MIVMYWINRKQFERKITNFLKKEKAQAATLEDVSSPLEDHHEKNISKRKTFNIQEEDMNIGDSLINSSTTLSRLESLADDGDIK
jgi:hypothetical protein